jgi:hypothetical protein
MRDEGSIQYADGYGESQEDRIRDEIQASEDQTNESVEGQGSGMAEGFWDTYRSLWEGLYSRMESMLQGVCVRKRQIG